MKINTTPGETYIVLSTGGCTATTGAGKQIKKLAAGQDFFTAMTGDTVISDDNASVIVAKGEMLSLLSLTGSGSGSDVQATLRFQPVASQSDLPATGENGVIYLVPNGASAPNQYTEWVWTGAAYEQLGDVGVDLSGYTKKSELAQDVNQAFSNTPLEAYSMTVTDGLTVQSTQGGTGSRLTVDDDATQNSETFDSQFLLIDTDVMVQGGVNAKSVLTSDLRSAGGFIDLSEGLLVGTLNWDANKKDQADTRDFGHPLAIYADSMALGAGWVEVSHVQAMLDVETPALKSPDGPMVITGTMEWDSNAIDKTDTSDLGHPRAVYASGMALGAMWAEVSHVQAMIDVETPILKAPDGSPLSVMSSLQLYTYRNSSGGTEVPTLTAPNIECETLSTREIQTEYMDLPNVNIKAKSIQLAGSALKLGVEVSEMVKCYIDSGCNIEGPGWDKSFSDTYTRLGLGSGTGTGTSTDTIVASLAESVLSVGGDNNYQLYIGKDFNTNYIAPRLISNRNRIATGTNYVEIIGSSLNVNGGVIEVVGSDSYVSLTDMARLLLGEGSTIGGAGWDDIVADIQAGAAAAAAAEVEQESFTKLIFPPTGTATEEQDPLWITKKNILMETNGGQLNMTQLTATLAYAAQTPLAIAKRTLWLSTSSGTGDAVQWPVNAVFPDDQSQDKIQQLNSNSTYWFDITYVGGSDTVLIRKVCSWASTTGESGPTE